MTQVIERQQPIFQVVVNQEEQFSIFPGGRPLPQGWRPEGMVGYRQECLNYIEQMRLRVGSLWLRRMMEVRGTLH